MKDLLNKLSSDLERIGEVTKTNHLSALCKFATPDPAPGQEIKRFNLDNDEDLRFDSGKWTIKPGVAESVKQRITEKLGEWLRSETVGNWQIDILIRGNASYVPIRMGNEQLANNRARSLKVIIDEVVDSYGLMTDDPNSSRVNKIEVVRGLVSGPPWQPGKDRDAEEYREHQYVTVSFEATGDKVPPEEPHDGGSQAKTGSWCINLGGLQVEVDCTVKGNVAKCSATPKGWAGQDDFGWYELKEGERCPINAKIINIPEEWKGYFYVCQDKCSGMLLKSDNGAPYVGVQNSEQLKPSLRYSWLDNFITYEQLESLCEKQADSKMIRVIEWPQKEECDDGLPEVISSDYCDEDSEKGMLIKNMLPIRKSSGNSNPGVVDIIYDYLSKGWRKPTYISGRMSSSSGGSSEGTTRIMDTGRGKKFYYFKSKRYSRDLARQAWSNLELGEDVNFGRESNERAIKDKIEEWIGDGDKLNANVKGIKIQRLFRVSARSLHTECSGWDYIRWGGPCETWSADSRYGEDVPELKGQFSGPNGGTSSTNPNSKPYLPRPGDNAKHQRILNWFIGHGGMSNEIDQLERRQALFYFRHSEGNDPTKSDPGDTQQTEQGWSHDQDLESRSNRANNVMDQMLDSRGFRRNLLRRIKKESSE